MPGEQTSISLLLGRLDDLEQIVTNQQQAINAINGLRGRDAEGVARIAEAAGEARMLAKILVQMQMALLGENFDHHWSEARKAAFPPQQPQVDMEQVAQQIRQENKKNLDDLRQQFESALNQVLRSIRAEKQAQAQTKEPAENIIPMPTPPEPKPDKQKPAAKPKAQQKPAESRDGVGVDRDEPV